MLRQRPLLYMPLLLVFLASPSVSAAVDALGEKGACADTLDYTFRPLASPESVHLCRAYQGLVIMVVNTASKCGYTYQYDGLEQLYDEYRDRGFVILGFPSNDFANQEPGSEGEIKAFCRLTYGIRFPMFEKTSLRGPSANPFFTKLYEQTGEYPQWNFHKYLIDRSGRVVKSFPSAVDPNDPAIRTMIEANL